MGFYTTFKYYRPGPFPTVTCGDLLRLWNSIRSAGVRLSTAPACRVKFGNLVADQEPLDSWEGHVLQQCVEGECDIDFEGHTRPSESAILQALAQHASQPVYRAHLHIGTLPEDARNRLYVPDPKNDRVVMLGDVGFDIDPVELSGPEVMESYLVSLMSLSISGNGYCYPRSTREVLDALRAEPVILASEQIVESIWPVPSIPPDDDAIAERRDMGELWMHDLERPHGWAWGYAY